MSTSTDSSSNSDSCENCSSNFSIFKRRKICSMCNQAFCQFCVNRSSTTHRDEQTTPTSRSSSSSERICVICQSICTPNLNADDLMKLKLKHLKCILSKANIPTNLCKDKRDLADLFIRNKEKFSRPRVQQTPPQQPQQNGQQQQQQQNFNNTFNNFFSNVQDFVNFNLNSVLNPNNSVPCPAPPPRPASNPPPRRTNSNTNTSTSSSTTTGNLGSVFNFFGEQFPNVLNQTFSNNIFNNNQQTEAPTATETNNIPRSRSQSNLNQNLETPQQQQAEPTSQAPKRRASLSDINTETDIDSLSIKQIKEILANNFVEYKGCCERKELVEKLKRLYQSHQENKRLEQEIEEQTQAESSSKKSNSTCSKANANEADLCKICMESLIECVLLDCGHMCSCIKCGKQLAECPICRQNVVRVVRVFKS